MGWQTSRSLPEVLLCLLAYGHAHVTGQASPDVISWRRECVLADHLTQTESSPVS